ncbi:MAG TPA: hypothetical protein EYQ60_15625 [Myxococcales bacterium]|nr:hypothetical protein [Myxococcales bacterium]HIK85843.1 hypothetical protein [Myxococcales bacterium]
MTTILDDQPVHDPAPIPAQFRIILLLSLGLLLSFPLTGCGSQDSTPFAVDTAPAAHAESGQGGGSSVAIVLEGREVTVDEVDEHMKNQFMLEFQQQPKDRQFALRENAARDLMKKIVMEDAAEKAGVTVEALYEDISGSVTEPTEEEVATWYAANQSRLQGRRLEDVATQISQHLVNERRTQALRDFLDPNFKALSMRMVLSPPRVELGATRLSRGADDAPVTITTFSDYQCPYCILAESILDEVLARYPEKVRIVHRHFPLDGIHPFARPAAEASMCADEQGQFWEFHQAIFNLSGKLVDGSLAKIGDDLGLDADKLKTCIDERRFKDFVEADFAAGRAAGITGTPAFYINGIVFSGERDADEMSRHVDLELARIEGR